MLEIMLALMALNAITFAAFGWDKWCAVRNEWRVPESTLLLLALVGGTPGAFAGRHIFHHKTRKQPFVSQLKITVFLQVVFLAAGAWLWSSGKLPEAAGLMETLLR